MTNDVGAMPSPQCLGHEGRESARRVSVLVVEDDKDIRDTVLELLEDEGYSVVSAKNGAEALALLRGVLPQLILLDLSLPVMSGKEFRVEQLSDPTLAAIPTVVMTAADRVQEKIANLQITQILAKPINARTLLDLVGRYCS